MRRAHLNGVMVAIAQRAGSYAPARAFSIWSGSDCTRDERIPSKD
jgi:hypothetical protein